MLASGTRLGPYELIAPLGAGGMGEVYRARDSRLGREVAIKVLPEAVASHPDRLARLEREARAAASLNHPSIVTLHSLEEAGGVRFLTMELVEGQTLDRTIVAGGLPVPRALEVATALADALAAAHAKAIVHRDLKPGNVMVTREGRIKVLDFGLAKLARADTDSDPEATQAATVATPVSSLGQAVGTVPYMAPEQIRGEAVDARTDLFAFGIVLFEVLTGRRPFAGATPADVASAILRDVPPRVLSLRADLPRDLDRIVARCLEKDPRDRFQTARDVYNELRYLGREAERSSPGSPASSAAMPATSATASASAASTPPSSGTRAAAPSIAVLPFLNRSRDEEDEYFADGLADELLNVLTKIRGLRVAARTSAFQFKGRNEDLASIGQKLNVATLLEGSVRKSGSRVRIAVQLVKVADGFHLWSETYDRTLEDIFAVQDDIARSVVKELRAALLGDAPDSKASDELNAEVAKAARGRGASGEAHRLYLQGSHLVDRLTRADTEKGMGYLREALQVDPRHALAWAALARALTHQAGYGWGAITDYERAREAANAALSLEPALAEGHAVMGAIHVSYDWDWKAADASYRLALELAAGNPGVLRGAASLAYTMGRADEAMKLARRAVEQDPLSPSCYVMLGHACRGGGRLPEAIEAFGKALELAPQRIVARMLMGLLLAAMNRTDEALAMIEAEPELWARLCGRGVVHAQAGNRAASDEALRQLLETHSDDSAYQLAGVYAARGEADEVFRWLERSHAQRDPGLAFMKLEPLLGFVHADPRWDAFLRKMRLVEDA